MSKLNRSPRVGCLSPKQSCQVCRKCCPFPFDAFEKKSWPLLIHMWISKHSSRCNVKDFLFVACNDVRQMIKVKIVGWEPMDTKYTEYQDQSHLAYLGYQQETIESPSLSFPINVYPKNLQKLPRGILLGHFSPSACHRHTSTGRNPEGYPALIWTKISVPPKSMKPHPFAPESPAEKIRKKGPAEPMFDYQPNREVFKKPWQRHQRCFFGVPYPSRKGASNFRSCRLATYSVNSVFSSGHQKKHGVWPNWWLYPNSKDPCMVYLPTFTIKINHS